jgi:acetolactate synthase-1/2/3 large subunit
MPGMHGTVAANRAIHHADVPSWPSGSASTIGSPARSPASPPTPTPSFTWTLTRPRSASWCSTHYPGRGGLPSLVAGGAAQGGSEAQPEAGRLVAWSSRTGSTKLPLRLAAQAPPAEPRRSFSAFHEATRGHAIVTTGVGQHQMFAAQYFTASIPRVPGASTHQRGFGHHGGRACPSPSARQLARPE